MNENIPNNSGKSDKEIRDILDEILEQAGDNAKFPTEESLGVEDMLEIIHQDHSDDPNKIGVKKLKKMSIDEMNLLSFDDVLKMDADELDIITEKFEKSNNKLVDGKIENINSIINSAQERFAALTGTIEEDDIRHISSYNSWRNFVKNNDSLTDSVSKDNINREIKKINESQKIINLIKRRSIKKERLIKSHLYVFVHLINIMKHLDVIDNKADSIIKSSGITGQVNRVIKSPLAVSLPLILENYEFYKKYVNLKNLKRAILNIDKMYNDITEMLEILNIRYKLDVNVDYL